MHRRSIASELAYGALGASLVAALAMTFVTFAPLKVRAAPSTDDQSQPCINLADDLTMVRQHNLGIGSTVFAGPQAKAAVAVLTKLAGPPPVDLSGVTAVLLVIGTPDANPPAIFHFYGADGCAFYAVSTDFTGSGIFLKAMGTGA